MTSHEFWAIWHMSGKTIESITQEIKDKRTEATRLGSTDSWKSMLLNEWANALEKFTVRYHQETATLTPLTRMRYE